MSDSITYERNCENYVVLTDGQKMGMKLGLNCELILIAKDESGSDLLVWEISAEEALGIKRCVEMAIQTIKAFPAS